MFFPLVLLLLSLNSNAEIYHGTLSAAMGGAGRAGIEGSDGALLNPALVPLMAPHEIDAVYRDGYSGPGQYRSTYGLGMADNSRGLIFSGALHYLRLRDTGLAPEAANSELIHLAIGQRLSQHFALGVSAYHLNSTYSTLPTNSQWNWSLGGLWTATPDIGVAYVLNNIAKSGSDVPLGMRQDLQQAVGFFASIFEEARVRVDLTRNEVGNPYKKLAYMAGIESRMNEFFLFRMGYRFDDQQERSYVTAGLGFEGPRMKLDYSFEKDLRGTSGALHGVDIRVPF